MHINDIFDVSIIRLNNEGNGVALIDNMVVFVKNALENEDVKIKITEVYDNYLVGEIIEILKESNEKIKPICPYYEICGGCHLMHMNYNKELEFKKNKIKSIFKKISNIDIDVKDIISFDEYHYRNKVVLKINKNNIGFYKERTKTIVNIDKCYLTKVEINNELIKLKSFINEYQNNDISEIMIRVIDNKIMLSLDNINNDLIDEFINIFNNVNSIYINDKLVYGEEYLIESIDDLKFRISPKSFFQINKKVSEEMYKKVVSYINDSDTTLDLYSGTGTITSLVSKKSKNVFGIEVNKDAVKDANENIKLNNIKNVRFICDKVENKIEELKSENIDNIILDPPRTGSDKKTLNNILDISPKQVIYISCNPVTLARDYNTLKEKYNIKEITAFDMFPNTYHVETVMILEKKDV